MRRLPDIIIVVGVIAGAIALAAGFRVVGVCSFLAAALIGWKRNWCLGAIEELLDSSEHHGSGSSHEGSDASDHHGSGDDGHVP